ncbi:drug/metabolite transporter superfamily, partial [Vararia minispora EC-137]
EALRDFVDNNAGLLLVALAQFFLALVNVAVKELNVIDNPVPTLELVWVRMFITYLCSIAFMLWQSVPDPFLGPKGVRLLLVFRGFVGFFGLFGVYFSLQYLSLSDATVLTFLSPIFTGIAGSLFLKEPFSRKELLAGLCSFAGVVLIARPEFLFGHPAHAVASHGVDAGPPSEKGTPTQRLVAVGVSLIGVLGATGAYTTIRAIGKRAHPLHSLAFFSSQSVVVATIGMLVTHQPVVIPTRWDWLAMLAVIGIFGFIAQVLLTMGLQREAAGRAALAIYIGIIYALALEKIFFDVSPSALSIAGMAIILSAALYIAV